MAGLPVLHPAAAGIDIGSRFHVVAVPGELDYEPVRTFQAFTADIERMADWLVSVGIQTVAMESTGAYWVPGYAAFRDMRCKADLATIRSSLVGNYQPEHVFALSQALAGYDFYQAQVKEIDIEIERSHGKLSSEMPVPTTPLPAPKHKTKAPNAPDFDVRPQIYQLAGVDLTQIHGVGPYLA